MWQQWVAGMAETHLWYSRVYTGSTSELYQHTTLITSWNKVKEKYLLILCNKHEKNWTILQSTSIKQQLHIVTHRIFLNYFPKFSVFKIDLAVSSLTLSLWKSCICVFLHSFCLSRFLATSCSFWKLSLSSLNSALNFR